MKQWTHAQLTTIPYLATRHTYAAHVRPTRVRRLRERLAAYRPRFVIFYGVEYLSWWSEIAGLPLVIDRNTGFAIAAREGTTFGVAKHPVARGLTTDYFARFGEAMRRTARSLPSSETLTEGLTQVQRRHVHERLLALRGKLALDIDLDDLRGRRRG